jgi:O-antigen/teichoic acid export membrane protein
MDKPRFSLSIRYISKLATNLAGAILGMVTIWILPQTMGASNYGKIEYILSNFQVILSAISLNIPLAYFNFVSRKTSLEAISAATGVICFISLAAAGLFAVWITASWAFGYNKIFWPEIPPWLLASGLIVATLLNLLQLLSYLGDGVGFTVELELLKMGYSLFMTFFCVGAFYLHLLNSEGYIAIRIFWAIVIIGVLAAVFRRKGLLSFLSIFKPKNLLSVESREFLKSAIHYAKPLIPYSLLGAAVEYFDRWFLQLVSGAANQGTYSLAFRLSSIAILFSTSITPVLTREFAQAFERNDLQRQRSLFERIRILLFISTMISVFLAVEADTIVATLSYSHFPNIVFAISIMAFYPIHQTVGQLTGAFFYGKGETRLYSKVCVVFMIMGFAVSYLVIAPASYILPGLDLGALGLSIKNVAMNVLVTNVLLYYATRILSTSYRQWLMTQSSMIIVMLVTAMMGKFAVDFLLGSLPMNSLDFKATTPGAIHLCLSGLIFGLASGAIVLVFPGFVGCTREEISKILAIPFRMIKSIARTD